jgi:hypothetical protein
MTRAAERLPIPAFVPKQPAIAPMRDDVIDQGAERHAAVVETLRPDGRQVAGSHPAERVSFAKQERAAIPSCVVPALTKRPAGVIDGAGVRGAAAPGDQGAATRFHTKHGHNVSRN